MTITTGPLPLTTADAKVMDAAFGIGRTEVTVDTETGRVAMHCTRPGCTWEHWFTTQARRGVPLLSLNAEAVVHQLDDHA